MNFRILLRYMALLGFLITVFPVLNAQTHLSVAQVFDDDAASDQDDMCIWIHPDPTLSTVIGSDKSAGKLFVFDLQGNTLQTISLSNDPRNIDVRYNFTLSGESIDIVGLGMDVDDILFYTVDPVTRMLSPAGTMSSGMSDVYGFAFYHNRIDDKFYMMLSPNSGSGEMRQWEVVDNGDGTIGGIHKRTWVNGPGGLTEGLVVDDETQIFYAAAENVGIYKYDANPTDPNPTATLVTAVGQNGLTADIEGIAIYYAANGEGYLIASSQGSSDFKVYERKAPHAYVKTLTVASAGGTDGLDVTNVNMGGDFSSGMFIVHSGSSRLMGTTFGDAGLNVDTDYWNPRNNTDNTDPGPVTGFDIQTDNDDNRFVFAFWDGGSSGDDGTSGTIDSYEIRWTSSANDPINNDARWNAATMAYSSDAASFTTGTERIDMSAFPSGAKYFAIRTFDEAGNRSPLNSGSYTGSTDFTLPVSLVAFTASSRAGEIILTWETASEINNEGFFLYRAMSESGPFVLRLNASIIPGHGNTTTSSLYGFTDSNVEEGGHYNYQLVSRDFDGTIHPSPLIASAALTTRPSTFDLKQNYPNPFNPSTTIGYTLPRTSPVNLVIFNSLGHPVRTLVSGSREAGNYTVEWDGCNDRRETVSSGIYFYRLDTDTFTLTRKLLLLQ